MRFNEVFNMINRYYVEPPDRENIITGAINGMLNELDPHSVYIPPENMKRVTEQFEGEFELRFNLAPPLLSRRDSQTGQLIKREFGPWIMTAFRGLARFRFLRGTALDPFGYTAERKQERADIEDYRQLLDTVMATLEGDNYSVALELARQPAKLRGFGHVKERNRAQLATRRAELLQRLRGEDDAVVKIVDAAA